MSSIKASLSFALAFAGVALVQAAELPNIRVGGVKTPQQVAKDWAGVGKWPNFWEGTWQILEGNADDVKPGPLPGAELAPQIQQIIAAAKSGKVPMGAMGPPGGGISAGCGLLGMPIMMTIGAMPIKIFPTPDLIAIYVESGRATRFLHMDGRSHTDPPNPTFYGDSIAHWEGATLVVDTVGIQNAILPIQQMPSDIGGPPPEELMKMGPGMWPGSAGLRIVERLHLKDKDTLAIDVTFIDPTVYAKPYVVTHLYRRYTGKLNAPQEWVCSDDRDRTNPTTGETQYNVRP